MPVLKNMLDALDKLKVTTKGFNNEKDPITTTDYPDQATKDRARAIIDAINNPMRYDEANATLMADRAAPGIGAGVPAYSPRPNQYRGLPPIVAPAPDSGQVALPPITAPQDTVGMIQLQDKTTGRRFVRDPKSNQLYSVQ